MARSTAASKTTTAQTVSTGGIGSTSSSNRVDVTLKLPQLQNFCKRDPQGYKSDYDAQIRRLESELKLLQLGGGNIGSFSGGGGRGSGGGPSSSSSSSATANSSLMELMQFAAAVSSSSYKGVESDKVVRLFMDLLVGGDDSSSELLLLTNETSQKSMKLMDPQWITTLSPTALQLDKHIRKTAVSALILMRNKGVVQPLPLWHLFFRLLSVVPDKALRDILYQHLIQDVRNLNKKHQAQTLNKSIQTFLHRIVSTHGVAAGTGGGGGDGGSTNTNSDDCATNIAARKAVDMVCELYRRRVWNDERTVAIVASAVTSPNTNVMCRALRFFLNIETQMADDTANQLEQETNERTSRIDYHAHSKKTAARQRHIDRQLKNRKKALRRKAQEEGNGNDWLYGSVERDKGVEVSKKLYPAIELLRDPQGLAEATLKRLRTTSGSYKYEVKLLMMNFCTRLVGNHQLLLLPLYPFLTKYLNTHQRHVTQILAYAVQACHELVPPDDIYLLLKTIAHQFITERCSEEHMAVGINAARAICARVPTALSVEESKDNTGIDGASSSGAVVMDVEAFVNDLAAFAMHRDRSVATAGKSWLNLIRDINPKLLKGKKWRGLQGTAGVKAGVAPLRYGEHRASSGVEGADLLAEYEAKKNLKSAASSAAASKVVRKHKSPASDGSESNADESEDGWEDVPSDDDGEDGNEADDWEEEEVDEEASNDSHDEEAPDDREGEAEDEDSGESDDESAPNLVLVGDDSETAEVAATSVPNVSKMSVEERDKLKQEMSSTRIFSASDFVKMRKLVERERKLKTDPREAARRKRAIANGLDVDGLSGSDDDDSDDDDEEDAIRIDGAVDPSDIMAEARKKRQSKAEKLEKIVAGRTKFMSRQREGGSTNVEKKRRKNFVMSKFSQEARSKRQKGSLSKKRKNPQKALSHEAKKRRRKL